LAAAGVHPKTAQVLARHSSITLTMNRYTHLHATDYTAALDKLPAPPTSRLEGDVEAGELAATGTDGARKLAKGCEGLRRGCEGVAKKVIGEALSAGINQHQQHSPHERETLTFPVNRGDFAGNA